METTIVYWSKKEIVEKKMETTIWEFPKIRGTILGVPIIRTIVFWGLYWGPLILGNYHIVHWGFRSCGLGSRDLWQRPLALVGDVRVSLPGL